MSSKPLVFRLGQRLCRQGLLVASMLGAPNLAQAQGVDEFGTYGNQSSGRHSETPINFALELRMGPYLPRVDSEFQNYPNPPFQYYFGNKNRLSAGLELDWLPFVVKDTLRLGAGIGAMYTAVSADAFRHDNGERAAGQTTSLRVFPHWITAVLRLDALARRASIPVVFSAKLGFAHALWWTSDQPRNTPAYDGTMGRGRSYGMYYGVGANLDLSFLEPTRRKLVDSFLGINHIYFFGELYALELNGFGSSRVMNVGDRSWVLGLALDF
jgi:hypothetical protein